MRLQEHGLTEFERRPLARDAASVRAIAQRSIPDQSEVREHPSGIGPTAWLGYEGLPVKRMTHGVPAALDYLSSIAELDRGVTFRGCSAHRITTALHVH